MSKIKPYTIVEVNPRRFQINQGSTIVGLRLTRAEAEEAVERYTREEIEAGNIIEEE